MKKMNFEIFNELMIFATEELGIEEEKASALFFKMAKTFEIKPDFTEVADFLLTELFE